MFFERKIKRVIHSIACRTRGLCELAAPLAGVRAGHLVLHAPPHVRKCSRFPHRRFCSLACSLL